MVLYAVSVTEDDFVWYIETYYWDTGEIEWSTEPSDAYLFYEEEVDVLKDILEDIEVEEVWT